MCVFIYLFLNNGVGRLCLGRVEDCHKCGWTSGGPCIGVNGKTCSGSYVTGMVAIATIVAIAAAVAILIASFACVCDSVVGSRPSIARGAPFVLLVINSATIDWSAVNMVEQLISDAWRTEL